MNRRGRVKATNQLLTSYGLMVDLKREHDRLLQERTDITAESNTQAKPKKTFRVTVENRAALKKYAGALPVCSIIEQLLLAARWDNAQLQRRIDVLEAHIARNAEIVADAECAKMTYRDEYRRLEETRRQLKAKAKSRRRKAGRHK